MTPSSYSLFDGTVLDLSAITDIGPIVWNDDADRPGSYGEFRIIEHGRRKLDLCFGISALVGPFRFLAAVRGFSEEGGNGCPARKAYASLSAEARRMLEIRHADLVAAWQSRPPIARAA